MRHRLSKNRSKRIFTKNATRVHPKNFNVFARGGIRL